MGKNIIEQWDYRWKIVSLTFLIFSIAAVSSPLPLLSALTVSLIILSVSNIPGYVTLKSLKPPLTLLLMMSPFIIMTPGLTPLWKWYFIGIYKEGFLLLFVISIKSITIFTIFSILIQSSNSTVLMHAMKEVGIPGKMVSILISTYRYIFLYTEDLEKLLSAARLKGFSLTKGFSHLVTSSDIMLTLLIRSYEQSERVQAAMTLRGYTGEFHSIEKFKTRLFDPIICGIIVLCCSGILSLEYLC